MIRPMHSLLVAALLSCSLMAFAGGSTDSGATEATAAVRTGQYGEAPMLAALVAAGELPPVDERLPVNPPVHTRWRRSGSTAARHACSPTTTGRGRT